MVREIKFPETLHLVCFSFGCVMIIIKCIMQNGLSGTSEEPIISSGCSECAPPLWMIAL